MDKNLKEKKTTLRPTRAELPPSQTLDFSKLVEDYTIYDTTQLDQAEDVYWRDVRPLTLPARYRYGNASEIQGASQYSRELKRNLTADEVIKQDQLAWELEYADIPPSSRDGQSTRSSFERNGRAMPNVYGDANLSEFSTAYLHAGCDSKSDITINHYFSIRNPDLSDVARKVDSPEHTPSPLIPSLSIATPKTVGARIKSRRLNDQDWNSKNSGADAIGRPTQSSFKRPELSASIFVDDDVSNDGEKSSKTSLLGINGSKHRSRLPIPIKSATPHKAKYVKEKTLPLRATKAPLTDVKNSLCTSHTDFSNSILIGAPKHDLEINQPKLNLFAYEDGKFPLITNETVLVWPSMKLGTVMEKTLFIRNRSEKGVRFVLKIDGIDFRLSSSETAIIELKGLERRPFQIEFKPTVFGKATGKAIFRPIDWPDDTERYIHLMAYGGSSELQLQGVEFGSPGSASIRMGENVIVSSSAVFNLKKSFKIDNNGPLNGVAWITIAPNSNDSQITVEPSKCVIGSGKSAMISVSYKVQHADMDKLRKKSCETLTVGRVKVMLDSESNRQRIISILNHNKGFEGPIPAKYQHLCMLVDFPVAKEEDFSKYRDTIEHLDSFIDCIKTTEIALTLSRKDTFYFYCNKLYPANSENSKKA